MASTIPSQTGVSTSGTHPAPRVSIVLPAYNAGEFIADTLRSVFSQTFTDYEVLVLDNASTDNTQEVVAQFSDPRLTVRRNEVNIGYAGNVQRGRDLAIGEYVVVLNADDLWEPGYLDRTVAVLDANPAMSVVHTRIVLMDESGGCFGESVTDWPAVTPGREAVALSFLAGFSSPTMLMRGSVLRTIPDISPDGPWAKIADCWLLLQLCLRGDVGYVAEPQMRYRVHPASMMSAMYIDGSFFQLRLDTLRDAYSWPELSDPKYHAEYDRILRCFAIEAAATLSSMRARYGRLPIVLAYLQLAKAVPSIVLHPQSWARLAYSLMPRALIEWMRQYRRRRWAASNPGWSQTGHRNTMPPAVSI